MKRQRQFLDANPAPFKSQRAALAASSRGIIVDIPRPMPLNRTQAMQVRRLITANEEVKYFDTRFNALGASLAGTTTDLCLIPAGNAQSNRIGDKIKILKVQGRIFTVAADATNIVRAIIWTFKSNTAAAGAGLNVVLNFGAAGAQVETNSPYNGDRKLEYSIKSDKTMMVETVGPNLGFFKWDFPLKSNNIATFTPGATTGTNHLHISYLSDSVAVAHPGFNGVIRVYYTDA